MRSDAAWYRNPRVLATRPLEFFPARGMTAAERLNSMVRFVLYSTALLALYRKDATVFWWGLVIITILSGFSPTTSDSTNTSCTRSNFTTSCTPPRHATCTRPTHHNPFMNVLASEYSSNKPPACPITPETMQQSQAYFDRSLPREISDVYRNRASDRQFVTMPATGLNGTPDTLAFRNYLFAQTAKGTKCK